MSRELLQYFSFSALPFDKEISTDNLLELPSTKQALSTLRLLVDTRGIGTLCGKSGTGKSCLVRKLISELNGNLYKTLYLCHTSVGLTEFYANLAVSLGLEPVGRKAALFRVIKERLYALHRQSRIHPLLIIDEAHLLSNEILGDLRLLTNFEIDSTNALTIILCGQESLMQKFSLTIMESLANSITLSVRTEGLPKEESFSYIESRISASGGSPGLISKNAMNLIHQASGGILRSIGTIAMAGLQKTMLSGAPQVEAEHIQAVIQR